MAASTALQVIVSPLLGTIFDKLSTLIQHKISLVLGVNSELKKLSKILSTIRDVLEDAEDKQITNKPINNWLKELKDAAYDVEDILDEYATFKEVLSLVHSESLSERLGMKRIKFKYKIAKRIRKVRQRFDEIAEERSKFHLNPCHHINSTISGGSTTNISHRETTSFLPVEPKVYGRDEEKEELVNLLLNNNIDRRRQQRRGEAGDQLSVSVCPILGMGGLGKTTLAQMVYNDERMVKHFEIRSWVYVSPEFELKTLFKAIIESLCKAPTDLENLDSLEKRQREILNGKRFLLVLDDVWNEDPTKWDRLKSSLITCGGKAGSSIIVTTRLEKVARLTSVNFPMHRLKLLSHEDCFTLFKHRAFDHVGDHHHHPKLKEIGKEIVKKCGGVPLAAKALGGLLRFKREVSEWVFVRDSKILDLQQTDDQVDSILPSLKLSYNHLPSNLRQCFAYCAIFPKNYKLAKKELIPLWMANCFIQPKGDMQLFDVGNEIFNDLLWRSFFQDVEEDEHGNVTCKMHDLVHDLASSIMANECSVVEVQNAAVTSWDFKETIKHLSLDFGYSSLSTTYHQSSLVPNFPLRLRTLFQIHLPLASLERSVPRLLTLSKFKFLRVLNMSQTNITSFEFESSKLLHLRYIDLSRTAISSLPESICDLRNLQTLILHNCNELRNLPNNMNQMSKLLHLDVCDCPQLTAMPTGIGELTHLQTLPCFHVSPKKNSYGTGSSSGGGGIEEIQKLNHLRGELTIKAISQVKNSSEAKKARLREKHSLHSLVLSWSELEENYNNTLMSNNSEEEKMAVAGFLQPHQNIRRLSIEGYDGLKFPVWMWNSSCLGNLVNLALVGCRRCEHLPPLGQLPLLKVLKISELDSVKYIGNEFYGDHADQGRPKGSLIFQSLEELHISGMKNLEEWSPSPSPSPSSSSSSQQVFGCFPCLKKLNIFYCPKLRTCPPLPSTLRHFDISTCNALNSLSRGFRHLRSLQTLDIKQCNELELLHDDFRDLISLRKLVIVRLPKLTHLPAVGLLLHHNYGTHTTLEHLELFKCSGLTTLPEWIANLTTSLRTLRISGCRNMRSLPRGLERLITSLQTLDIRECHRDLEEQIVAIRNDAEILCHPYLKEEQVVMPAMRKKVLVEEDERMMPTDSLLSRRRQVKEI